MTLTAVAFFVLGFLGSWTAGRFLTRGAAAVQGLSIGVFGVAAFLFGMPPEMMTENLIWALIALLIYGLIGALIFRAGQAAKEKAE